MKDKKDLALTDYRALKELLPRSSFRSIADCNQIFVDKTDLVHILVTGRDAIFLSRPHGFGKSTLVSVLKELFTHGVKSFIDSKGQVYESYFKGLAIESLYQDDKTYALIHLDFSHLESCSDDLEKLFTIEELYDASNPYVAITRFEFSFRNTIVKYIKEYGFESEINIKSIDFKNLYNDFVDKLVARFGCGNVVLLIDDYDHYLTNIADDLSPKAKDIYSKVICDHLNTFFLRLKANFDKYRKIFITGNTDLTETVSSAMSFVEDITLDPLYSTIVGFTRDEIKTYFYEHLKYSALQLYHLDASELQDTHIEKLLDEMEVHYGGYSFDRNASKTVFSTICVLNFFRQEKTSF